MTAFSSLSPVSLDLSSIAFFGRTLAEYTRFFALDAAALRGRAVLDVAAGPSSFTAEACRAGIAATALDPLYGCPPAALAVHVQLDYARMGAQIRARPELFRLGPVFASFEAAERDRRESARRFLDDYEAHFVHDRYVGGALPRLPFADGQFDLVLCGHLLFLHGRQFDPAFYRAACRELVRVSRGEVRIHPLCGADGRPYGELERLRGDLAAEGIASQVVAVDYEFFRGGGRMLVLGREGRAPGPC